MMKLKNFSHTALLVLLTVAIIAFTGCSAQVSNNVNDASDVQLRDEYVREDTVAFKDTDGLFKYDTVEWDGPEGYCIVIPAGDANAKKSAEILTNYYKQAFDISLKIITDALAETSKEILIGNTNRAESAAELDEGELSVTVNNGRLVFSGGHYVTVAAAVEKFARLCPDKGEAFTFSVETDFKATVKDGYEYVWGDEFEGSDVDFSKWGFSISMRADDERLLSYDKDVINVEDGRLKIHAIQYFDPTAVNYKYKIPYAVTHMEHMNFVYGYAEIRARIPFFEGVWPSWWGNSIGKVDGIVTPDEAKYHSEIDIFEVFGNDSQVVPNIHKWYTDDYFLSTHEKTGLPDDHSSFGQIKRDYVRSYDFAVVNGVDVSTLDNEYHIYGFEWTKDEMTMSVDGNDYMTFDITQTFDEDPDMQGFHVPYYFMFNCHITSSYTDTAHAGHIERSLDALPAQYYIDYYRVYQKAGVGSIYTNDEPIFYPDRK